MSSDSCMKWRWRRNRVTLSPDTKPFDADQQTCSQAFSFSYKTTLSVNRISPMIEIFIWRWSVMESKAKRVETAFTTDFYIRILEFFCLLAVFLFFGLSYITSIFFLSSLSCLNCRSRNCILVFECFHFHKIAHVIWIRGWVRYRTYGL